MSCGTAGSHPGSGSWRPQNHVSAESAGATWLDRRVFVTGGTGFAGSWLVGRLGELGAEVVCVVRDWVPRSPLLGSELPDEVTLVFGDIRDQALLERALGDYEIEVVFHLAAQTIVPIANRNPVETFDTNIRGTSTLLEACRRSPRVRSVVVASSDKAYGTQQSLPYREDTPLLPVHPYDVSKACSDLIARSYARTYDLPVAVTRAGNFFGGGDLNWSRLVPGTIRAALRGRRPVIRSDGTPLRDYVYVEDAVEAYVLLAEAVLDGRVRGEAVNISYERPLSVRQVVDAILAEAGVQLEPVTEGSATHEIHDQFLDATLARERLG
ncbi:MAG: NAD-dependent epimerase/dehydratase family protein, partial [Chloroflexi bacterium]|nr:NAD-dependent epimerase/dehydratase family protein [Chloroflexota bacterium]